MANIDLEKCPQLIRKTSSNLSNVYAQAKMAEAQMKFKRFMIKQNYDAQFLHDSVIIKRRKIKMNTKPNETDLLIKLNDLLVQNNLEFVYDFSLSTSSGGILIHLHEINEKGWEILIYNSCDGFIPIVEEQWEKDEINWNEAVLLQIKFNLTKVISDIGQIIQLFTSDFILKKEDY